MYLRALSSTQYEAARRISQLEEQLRDNLNSPRSLILKNIPWHDKVH